MNRKPSNLRISRMLMLSYGIVIALFVVSIAVALYGVHQNAKMTEDFYNRPYQVSRSAVALRSTVEEMSTYIDQLINAESDSGQERAIAAIDDLSNRRLEELGTVESLFTADRDLLMRFSEANDKLTACRNDIVFAIEAGDHEQATALYNADYLPQKEATVELATNIVDTAEGVA